MKTKIVSTLRNCLLSLTLFGVSNAQGELNKEVPSVETPPSSPAPYVSTKVDRAFASYFKNVTNLSWYEIKGKYLIKFKMEGRENKALFTRNGQLVYHITYGTESFLPAEVRRLIKSEYYDQKITRVLNVNQDQRNIWLVHMEDEKEFIIARVEDGELEETKRMEK
jgi:hypothetical protein